MSSSGITDHFTRGLDARAFVTGICLLLSATRPAPAQVEPPGQIALTRVIQSIEQGHADLSMLEGNQVQIFGEHCGKYEQDIRNLGALKSVKLRGMSVRRLNIYDVVFEHGDTMWQLGTGPPDGGAGMVVVHFVVRRNGRLSILKISKSSGDWALDGAAYNIVRAAQPLPAIPDRMHTDRVDGVLPMDFGDPGLDMEPTLSHCGD